MAYKLGQSGNTRDLAITGRGPGKGSKDRTSDEAGFKRHWSAIAWGTPILLGFDFSFNKVGPGRFIKKYK
jgi:hypothetical protein